MTKAPVARRRDREATRSRLLAAAIDEFARHGLNGARGERIAEQADSSERMLYYYFGSKEGVFRAALEAVYADLRDAERGLALDQMPPMEALDHFSRFVWRYYAEHPEFISLLNTENLHRGRHLRDSAQVSELVSPVIGMLADLLNRGATAGVFRDGLNPQTIYLAIASLGYFVLSNRHTLSAVLGHEISACQQLEAHWLECARIIQRYVAP